MLKEDSVHIPSFLPDCPVIRPDAHQCLEVSNSSRVHPFGHRVWPLIKVRQEIRFPSQTQIWVDNYILLDDRATPFGHNP